MLKHNKQMKEFLKANGIDAMPMYINKGSMRGCWRIYKAGVKWWGNKTLQQKMTNLGFVDFDRDQLDDFSGNGGEFSIFPILAEPFHFYKFTNERQII